MTQLAYRFPSVAEHATFVQRVRLEAHGRMPEGAERCLCDVPATPHCGPRIDSSGLDAGVAQEQDARLSLCLASWLKHVVSLLGMQVLCWAFVFVETWRQNDL